MKRTYLKAIVAFLIVATATSCYNLAPENTGALTSTDIYSGVGNVLNIDSLVSYVREITKDEDVEYYRSSGDVVQTQYKYDGKHHKEVRIDCNLYDLPVMEETGDEQKDSTMRTLQAYYQRKQAKAQQVYDAVVSTCKSLSNLVEPSRTNMWEHQDSVWYNIELGNYQTGDVRLDTIGAEPIEEASERVDFHHYPFQIPGIPASAFRQKGYGSFDYELTPDSVWNKTHELLDRKDFAKLIKPILSQKGIERRSFYISHDTKCQVKPTYQYGENNMCIWRETTPMDIFVDLPDSVPPAGQPYSETQGTVYTMHSREQMQSVLRQLTDAIWGYLARHPHTFYEFYPDPFVPNQFPIGAYKTYFVMKQNTHLHEDISLFIHNCRDDYNLLVLDTKGDMWLPVEWPAMKSWKNGQVVYDKKVQLTPQQMKDYAGTCMSMQEYYDVWTEFDKPKKKDKKK